MRVTGGAHVCVAIATPTGHPTLRLHPDVAGKRPQPAAKRMRVLRPEGTRGTQLLAAQMDRPEGARDAADRAMSRS